MHAFLRFFGLILVLLIGLQTAEAQQFQANYVPTTGRPTNLVVCGDADTAVYRISLAPSQPQARNIQVTVQLFDGVEAVAFDASTSSAGVTLVSLADPSRPVISLPNLVPTASGRRAEFGLVLKSKCALLDTINNHDDQGGTRPIQVFDRLSIRYDHISNAQRTELRDIDPYIAAIAAPVFSLTVALSSTPLRVGDRVTRTTTVSNGSFRGYADTLVYSVVQGRDASIVAMRINGVTKAFAKTPNGAGDTVITVMLFGDDFLANTDGASPGNLDQRFDPDESMIIEEDVDVLACGPRRFATHQIRFGCESQFCSVAENQSQLPIGSGQPELAVSRAAIFPDQNVGYCQPGEVTVWVSNVGRETDPTFGEARNIAVSALFSDISAALAFGGYQITQVDVAGVPITDVQFVMRLDTIAGFTSDPDGPGGLNDLDGDGRFDDLAVLDSFPMKVYYELDCSGLNDDTLDENCANDAFATVQTFAYFEGACGRRLNGRDINLYSPQNVQDDFEQSTQPDAFAEGAPFQVDLEFGRLLFRFDDLACSGDATIRTYVDLPAGVTIDASSSRLTRDNGTSIPILGVTQTGQVAMMEFDPSAEITLNGTYNLTVGLSADCTAELGETVFPTRVAYFCPSCACEHTWICEDIVGPWIHKTSPPCPVSSLFPCPQGVQGTSFSIDRTTFGFADENFTTPFPVGSRNTKAAIPADSVDIRITGTVGDNTVTDSFGIVVHYFTPNGLPDTAGLFLMGGGTLEWLDGATWRTCTVPATAHTLEIDSSETWQRFEVGQCFADNGWIVSSGDEIRFIGQFEINPAGPISDSYEFATDLRGGFYATVGGVETQCDQFGDIFRVGKPLTTFGVPTNSTFPKGCDQTTLEFRLTGVNRGYSDEFGLEYRRSARLDSLILTFDTAVLSAFDNLELELFVAGHPTQGDTYYPVQPLNSAADGRYVLRLDSLDYSSNLVARPSFLYNLRLTMSPNCSSIRGSSTGDEFYPITAEPFYRDRYYALDIGDGSRVDIVEENIPFTMSYSEPATLSLDVLTPPLQRMTADSAYMRVEICNTSVDSRAARSWITFDDTSSVVVETVELIDDINNPILLPLESFVNGHFVNMEALEQVNGINTSSQVCNRLRIKVRAIACGLSGIRMTTGWDCEATVPVGWTPDQDDDCVDDAGLAEFEPISPFLEADLISEPAAAVDLCTAITLEFQVNNAQPGTAYEVLSRLYVPRGLVYQAGSAQVEYPSQPGVDNFQPTLADLVPADTTVRGLGLQFENLDAVHPYLAANGLRGFDPTNPTDSNRFTLRLTFETDCEFRSGSIVFFETEGEEACGERTNFAAAESAALQIAGAEPDGTHGYAVGFNPDVRISLTQPVSQLEIFATNVGSDPSDADNVFQVTLPVGYNYEPGTTIGIEPAGYSPGEPTIDVMGGITKLEWTMPLGLANPELARLQFGVRPVAASCGDDAVAEIAAIRYISTSCVSQGTVCRIPTDITQGGSQLQSIPIGEVFDVQYNELSSVCESATTELVTINVDLTPQGFAFNGNPLTVALYHDANGDQDVGAGDVLLEQQTLAAAPTDASVNFGFSGSLNRLTLNQLIIRIDSIGQPLCAAQLIQVPLVPLDNAGDQDAYTVCASENIPVQLGDANCAGATDVDFAWTSVPTGFESYLSDVTSPNPQLVVPDPHMGPDTVRYVLASNRMGVGITRDTVTLIIGPGVTINDGPLEIIDFGDAVVLTADVQSGTAPFTYLWTPAAGLSSATDAQPIASPEFDQIYEVTVTDVYGCSASARQEVKVRTPINPQANVTDTLICPDTDLVLTVSGGDGVSWSGLSANPAQGGLSALTGNTVVFNSDGATGLYVYDVMVTDSAFPGYDSTIQITINVDPTAGCSDDCVMPALVSEVTTSSDCASPTGTLRLTYAAGIAQFRTYLIDQASDTVARDQLVVDQLAVGRYTLIGVSTTDPACAFAQNFYISGAGAPQAQVTQTPASCGEADGTATLMPTTLNAVWPDGDTNLSRTDLRAGIYRLAISTAADPACVRYQQIIIEESAGLDIVANVGVLPTCNANDGEVTLTVLGGSGDYDFGWSVNAATNANLSSGAYSVEVTDRISGCTGTVSFVLADNVPPAALAIVSNSSESCRGAADGRIDFTVAYDGGFIAPADTVITTSRGDTVANGSLTSGVYCITITDANGCVAGGDCVTLQEAVALRIDLESKDACGFDNGELTVSVREGATPLSIAYSDGVTNSDLVRTGFAPDAYTLNITDANGCTADAAFVIGQCAPCNYATGAGDTTQLQAACEGTAPICIGGIAQREADLVIYNNGAPYGGRIEPCDYARSRLTYLIGILNLNPSAEARLTIDGVAYAQVVSSLAELEAFFQSSDPGGNWFYESATQTIIGGRRGGLYSALAVQRVGSSLVNTVPYNERIEPFGLAIEVPVGFNTVVVYDSVANCADTIYANVTCAATDTLAVTVPVGDTATFCISTADLQGDVVSLTDICLDTTFATYTQLNDTCMLVIGGAVGNQTACIVACDDLGFCDTTIVQIEVTPLDSNYVWFDTILVDGSGSLCLTAADLGLQPGNLTITNTCQVASGTAVDFFVDDTADCIEYGGLSIGEESACLEICDDAGNCVSGTLTVTVIPEGKAIIRRTIFVNQTDSVCLDTITNIVSTNFFAQPDSLVEASINTDENCAVFRGLQLGSDTLGYEVVRADGSTYQLCIIIDVVPYNGDPEARPDSTCTSLNTPIRVNVLANDQVFGGVASFRILTQPSIADGSVTINSDNTITFEPAADVCARDATFTYEVCNPNAGSCATATVTICIECEELKIFTALSPNGDGSNDEFYIAKIEEFPDNHLQIFNRWGNLVYETTQYNNDWTGTYRGNPLPDGAYFYILEVNLGEGVDKTFNGYLEIMR